MRINSLTISEARKKLQDKEISSEELTKACLEQIEKHDKTLNAFITVCKDETVKQAKKADQVLSNSTIEQFNNTPLLGIPIALKDMYTTKGIRTTAGSKVLENYIPPFDATVVRKIKDAGAVILGKTNQDAWAHGSSGENSDFGPTRNPWNTQHVPGGSSSGSAAALSADMSIATTGTDTGGSIRLPASFCNVVGLKPTYGRVSRYGVVAMASSLDSIGHFTKTVEDSAIMLTVTAGQDEKDATTPPINVPNYTKALSKSIKGLRIGIPKEYFSLNIGSNQQLNLDGRVSEAVGNAIKKLEELGAEVEEISLPHTEQAIAVYYIIQPAEVSSNLARYDGIRFGYDRSHFGQEAKRRIMLGTYTLSTGYYDAYYKKAMQVRTLIKQDFDKAYEKVDAIITPVSPTLPWKIGEKVNDPLSMYLSDIYTVTINLAGIPGLSVPVGLIDGLPVGMQILGKHFDEETLFTIGHAYQEATDFHKKRPIL